MLNRLALPECLLNHKASPVTQHAIFKAKSGKLDIQRREPGILSISLPISLLFKMATMI